jgi:hypothetical protein
VAKFIVVLSFETTPEALPDILKRIDPPSLPGFTGQARIAVGPEAKYVETWLDEETPGDR